MAKRDRPIDSPDRCPPRRIRGGRPQERAFRVAGIVAASAMALERSTTLATFDRPPPARVSGRCWIPPEAATLASLLLVDQLGSQADRGSSWSGDIQSVSSSGPDRADEIVTRCSSEAKRCEANVSNAPEREPRLRAAEEERQKCRSCAGSPDAISVRCSARSPRSSAASPNAALASTASVRYTRPPHHDQPAGLGRGRHAGRDRAGSGCAAAPPLGDREQRGRRARATVG